MEVDVVGVLAVEAIGASFSTPGSIQVVELTGGQGSPRLPVT